MGKVNKKDILSIFNCVSENHMDRPINPLIPNGDQFWISPAASPEI